MTLRAILTFCHASAPLMACHGLCEHSGTPLLGGLMSQQSPEEVKRALGSPERWAKIRETRSARYARPSYDFLLIDAGPMRDLGVDGTARFEFFNDRLCSIYFTPKRFDAYLGALRILSGARLEADGNFHLPVRTCVSIGGAPGEYLSFEWYDECLREESDAWIKKDSGVSAKGTPLSGRPC